MPLRRKIASYYGKSTLVDEDQNKRRENWALGIGLVTLTTVEVGLIILYGTDVFENEPVEISTVVFCSVIELGNVIMGILVLKDLYRMQ